MSASPVFSPDFSAKLPLWASALKDPVSWLVLADDMQETARPTIYDENDNPVETADEKTAEIVRMNADLQTKVRMCLTLQDKSEEFKATEKEIKELEARIQTLTKEVPYTQPSRYYWGRKGPFFTRLLVPGHLLANDMTMLDIQPIYQLQIICTPQLTRDDLRMILRNDRMEFIESLLISELNFTLDDAELREAKFSSLCRFEVKGRNIGQGHSAHAASVHVNRHTPKGCIAVINGTKSVK